MKSKPISSENIRELDYSNHLKEWMKLARSATRMFYQSIFHQQAKGPVTEPHVLVISGIRKSCCGQMACTYEYQFYDSADSFEKSEMTSDRWVPEKIYFEKLFRLRSVPTPRPDLRTDLIWLE